MAGGELLQGGRVLELHGKEALCEGYERILTDSSLHLVVIRGLATLAEMELLQQDPGNSGLDPAALEAVFPAIAQINLFVKDWWAEFGYSDYALDPQLKVSSYIKPGARSYPHVDAPIRAYGFGGLVTGASLSVAGGSENSSAVVSSHRPRQDFRLVTGEFDVARWNRHSHNVNFRRYPGRVIQRPTDGVLLPGHPWPAVHKVLPRLDRWARLLDYFASEVDAPQPEPKIEAGLTETA